MTHGAILTQGWGGSWGEGGAVGLGSCPGVCVCRIVLWGEWGCCITGVLWSMNECSAVPRGELWNGD